MVQGKGSMVTRRDKTVQQYEDGTGKRHIGARQYYNMRTPQDYRGIKKLRYHDIILQEDPVHMRGWTQEGAGQKTVDIQDWYSDTTTRACDK